MRRLLTLVALAAGLWAQSHPSAPAKLPPWRIDPYTKNDPKLMALLGYVSYGPFPFGQRGSKPSTTDEADKALPSERILWVETAHFRIGSMLPEYVVPEEPDTKLKLRNELNAIAAKFGKTWVPRQINPKANPLDPWLRLHLTAYRMEELYKQFLDLVGAKEGDFPTDDGKVLRGQLYMGQGPYLGMKQKYEIMIFKETGVYQAYLQRFIGRVGKEEQRWHQKETGALWFGVAIDLKFKHDTALHQTLAHNIAHNMLDGFRHYSYDLPVWLTEGIAHWVERTVAWRWMSFCQNEASTADMTNETKWRSKARQLAEADPFKGSIFSEAFKWRDYSQISSNDHILIWARIDFLMSFGKDKFAAFLREIKGRIDAAGFANQDNLVGACREALTKVYGISSIEFDDKWKQWMKKAYPLQEEEVK